MRVASDATSPDIAGSGRLVTFPNYLQVHCSSNDFLYPVNSSLGICFQSVLVFLFSSFSYFVPFPRLVHWGNLNKNPFPVFGRIPGSTRLLGFISFPLRSSRFRFVLSFSNGFSPLISTGLSI